MDMILKIEPDVYLYCDTFHPNKDRMYVHAIDKLTAEQDHIMSVLEDNKPLIITADSDGEFKGEFSTPSGGTTWIKFKIGNIHVSNYIELVDVFKTLAANWSLEVQQDISTIINTTTRDEIVGLMTRQIIQDMDNEILGI
jgi:hypothetical protein